MAGGIVSRMFIRLKLMKINENCRNFYGISWNLIQQNNKLIKNESQNSDKLNKEMKKIHHNLNIITKRYKFGKSEKKGKSQVNEDEDDDDNDNVDESLILGKGNKLITPNVPSMRIDAVVKGGLGLARNKAEVALYESRIRINGEKVLKKGYIVRIDDVIDLIIGPSPKNPNFTLVNRITILNANSSIDHIKLKILREKNLIVDDYKDSYKLSDD